MMFAQTLGQPTTCPPGYVYATVGGSAGCYDPASIPEYQQSGGGAPTPAGGYPVPPPSYPSSGGFPPMPPMPFPMQNPAGGGMPPAPQAPSFNPYATAGGMGPQPCAKALFMFDVCGATAADAASKAKMINIAGAVLGGALAVGIVAKIFL